MFGFIALFCPYFYTSFPVNAQSNLQTIIIACLYDELPCDLIEDLETVPTAEKGEEVISRQDGFEVKIDIDDQEAGSELSVSVDAPNLENDGTLLFVRRSVDDYECY